MLGDAFDAVLVAARAGDERGFAALYNEFAAPVMRLAAARGWRDPEDVVAETMMAVARGLDRFEGGEADFRSWVFTIAYRRLADELRRRSRRVETEEYGARQFATDQLGPESTVLAQLGDGPALAALRTLNQDQQDVLILRIIVGLPIAEVAEIVGKKEAAVKMIQRRGLDKLRESLTESVTFPATGAI